MRKPYNLSAAQRGMTLVEVIVTLGILSVFFIGTLGIYSTTYKTLRTRDSLMNILDSSDLLMSYIGNDIRHAHEFLNNYQEDNAHTVVAAMKIKQGGLDQTKERIVVYALDAEYPNRLFRIVHQESRVVSIELSTHIHTFNVIPKAENLFEVQLILRDRVAGKVSTLQASSVYAMR